MEQAVPVLLGPLAVLPSTAAAAAAEPTHSHLALMRGVSVAEEGDLRAATTPPLPPVRPTPVAAAVAGLLMGLVLLLVREDPASSSSATPTSVTN